MSKTHQQTFPFKSPLILENPNLRNYICRSTNEMNIQDDLFPWQNKDHNHHFTSFRSLSETHQTKWLSTISDSRLKGLRIIKRVKTGMTIPEIVKTDQNNLERPLDSNATLSNSRRSSHPTYVLYSHTGKPNPYESSKEYNINPVKLRVFILPSFPCTCAPRQRKRPPMIKVRKSVAILQSYSFRRRRKLSRSFTWLRNRKQN